ncbi:21967_t:CDS:2, partial [Entrophospora sp. SA101]
IAYFEVEYSMDQLSENWMSEIFDLEIKQVKFSLSMLDDSPTSFKICLAINYFIKKKEFLKSTLSIIF